MTPELLSEAVIDLIILGGLLAVIWVGALIADHLFPRVPLIRKYIDRLPEYDDE